MDKPLFTTVDPRGIIIECQKEQWDKHILLNHAGDMSGRENEVESSVKDPDIIIESNEYTNRDVYFKSTGKNDLNMKTIVEVSQNTGEVITAFIQKGIKGNINTEVVKYVKPKL